MFCVLLVIAPLLDLVTIELCFRRLVFDKCPDELWQSGFELGM